MTAMPSARADAGRFRPRGVPAGACTVFSFMFVDRSLETSLLAPFKATRESIANRYVGLLLEGTAQFVDPADLDEQGRYMRRPTGWSDLGS